jgi:hypothetical protein
MAPPEAPVQRVPGHDRLGQVVQTGAVDDHSRFPDGVDERPSGGVAEDVDASSLPAIHESLPDIAMDDQFARGEDLPQLILPVAMDGHAGAIQSGGEIVARAPVHIDLDAVGAGPEAAAEEALPVRPEDQKPLPALLRAVAEDERYPLLPFHGEPGAIDGQDLLPRMRCPQHLEVVQVDQRYRPNRRGLDPGRGTQHRFDALVQLGEDAAAPEAPGRIPAVDGQG